MASPAPSRARRPVSLLDLMILVLAIAPGFALARFVHEELSNFLHPASLATFWGKTGLVVGVMTPVLLTLTAGFLVLRLRPPRRRGKRLWRSQGALILATLSCVGPIAGPIIWAICLVSGPVGGYEERLAISLMLLPIAMAGAAGAVLLAGRLLGLRAGSPDWLDRLGVAWGVLWFIVAPIDLWTLIY